MNEHLWEDSQSFDSFYKVILALNHGVKDRISDPTFFSYIANKLDEVMALYETPDRPILDPIFFWSFAASNAMFLLVGQEFDELGPSRISYIMNGHKEGLYKHKKYPSYPQLYINKAFEHMAAFAQENDMDWINDNKHAFHPIES